MPRRRQRDTGTSHTPSQPRLRGGEFVQFVTMVLASTLVMLSPAFAEVCDKVAGDNWQPADGPVWTFHLASGLPTGFILVGGLVLVGFAQLRWLAYGGSTILAIMIAFVLTDMIQMHDVYRAAIREGCRSFETDLFNLGLMIAFALAYAWLGYRAKRPPDVPESEARSGQREGA